MIVEILFDRNHLLCLDHLTHSPRRSNLTSFDALSPSILSCFSIFFDLSNASFSLFDDNMHPIAYVNLFIKVTGASKFGVREDDQFSTNTATSTY